MAQALAVNLSPPAAVTEAGASSVVDLGEANVRNVLRLDVRITAWNEGAIVGVAALRLTLETSPDSSTWRTLETESVSGHAKVEWGAVELDRYLRLSWTLAELTSVTFRATGFADLAYAAPGDLERYGLPAGALEGLTLRERIDICVAAADEAEGYMAAAYTLPLVAWTEDLRLHCAKMAVRYTLDRRGWDPESRDNVIETAFDRAIGWLKMVAKGMVRPPGIIDSAPEVFEAGSVVMSRPRRDNSWL